MGLFAGLSKRHSPLLGYKESTDALRDNLYLAEHGQDTEAIDDQDRTVKKEKGTPKDAELRRRAEERLTGKKRETDHLPAEEDARRMVPELQVHQIELELQNEVMGARIIPCNRSWPKKQLSIRKGGNNYV